MMLSGILILHIAAGTVGLLSGAAALIFRKGSGPHRRAGNVFFVSMLGMSASGAYIAYVTPVMISVIVGILTFYLVATAWMAVVRRTEKPGPVDAGALLVALATGIAGITFGLEAAGTDTGLKDGFAAGVYYFFGGMAVLAAMLDTSVFLRRGIAGAQRIARHLWRMCFGLFIAAASFFLGQQQVFPDDVRGSPVLFAPVILVLALMFFWLGRVLFTGRYGKRQDADAAGHDHASPSRPENR